MVNGRNQWDYLTDSLFHGLRTLLGAGFVDVFKRHYMYVDGRAAAARSGFVEYGRGFSYAWALQDDKRISRNFSQVRERIRAHYYDIIIVGQLHTPIQGKMDW